MKTKTPAEQVRDAILADEAARTPEERFEDMVARGVITRGGEVTTRIGGSAKPEEQAKQAR